MQQTLVVMEQAGSTTRAAPGEMQQTLVEGEQDGSSTRAVPIAPAEVQEED